VWAEAPHSRFARSQVITCGIASALWCFDQNAELPATP